MAGAITIRGTLNADGTLQLDRSPGLPPGRVEVTLQAVPAAEENRETVWEALDRIHANQEARGFKPRTREEIDAEMRAMREQDAERDRMIDQIHEDASRARDSDALSEGGRA